MAVECKKLAGFVAIQAKEDERVWRVLDLAGVGHECDCDFSSDEFVCKKCGRRFDMASPVTRDDICPHAAVEWTMEE
jgi:hypothetical protein